VFHYCLQRLDNPIPRPPPSHELKCNTSKPYHSGDTCFPTETLSPQDWTISQVFGKPIKGICPLADPAIAPVCVQAPSSRHIFTSSGVTELKLKETERCYFPPPEGDFELVLPHMQQKSDSIQTDSADFVKPERPLLYAERSFTGHGQQRGGVQTIFTNPSPDSDVEFVYLESLPWFMRIYLHTLQARVSHKTGSNKGSPTIKEDDVIQEIYYRPFLDRQRGTQLELRMRIPPASTVFMTYDFEKAILRYTEYPPDANRGFDAAAAVITILSPQGKTSNLRTTSLLLNLPTPDFSMPYNVIIFTSTAIAFAFGGLYNILIRRFVGRDEGPEVSIVKLKRKIREVVQRLKLKMKKPTVESAQLHEKEKVAGKVD
jgi:GPI-anchor transamidase subunit T